MRTKSSGAVVVIGLATVFLLMNRRDDLVPDEPDHLLAQANDDSQHVHPIPISEAEQEKERRRNERARNEKQALLGDRFIQSVAQLDDAPRWQQTNVGAVQRGDSPVLVPRPGSENPVKINQNVWFDLIGVPPEDLAGTKLLHYPRNGVFVMDGQSWGGKPFVLFSAQRNGGYLLAVITEGVEGIEVGEYEVSVGGQPDPDPQPDPQPNPDPTPDPLDGLALRVRNWALTEVSPGARNLATSLSRSFDSIASRIAAGTLPNAESIIVATAEGNRSAVGETGRQQWLGFFQALRIYLNLESEEKRLVTVRQYEKVWREIAEGLAAVEGYEW